MNYFLLLGLSFDPPEQDPDVIKAAIAKKRSQWQGETRNPRKQIKARENIAMIPDIERVMFDPSLRMAEANNAINSQKRYINNLENELLIIESKGFITEKELNRLVTKYEKHSIGEDFIRGKLSVSIGDSKKSGGSQDGYISETQRSQLESLFASISVDDMSLYSYFGVNEPEEIVPAANIMLKNILDKGNKEYKDEIDQQISSLALNIFPDDQVKYDNYLKGARYASLNNFIQTAVEANGIIDIQNFNAVLQVAEREYPDFIRSFLVDYILENCKINNYEVDPSVDTFIAFSSFTNQPQQIIPVEEVNFVEAEEEVILEPEISENDQQIMNIIEEYDGHINRYYGIVENSIRRIRGYKENREKNKLMVDNKFFKVSAIVSGILMLLDLVIYFFINARGSFLALPLVIASLGLIGYLKFMNIKWNEMLKHFNDAEGKYQEVLNDIGKYVNFDKNTLFSHNEGDLNYVYTLVNGARINTEHMRESCNLYVERSRKYLNKKNHYLGLGILILAHVLEIALIIL